MGQSFGPNMKDTLMFNTEPASSDESSTLIPIVTANCAPFRIVSRGSGDSWSPTTDQINKRTYDYIKLHRLSAHLDIGITPFSLGICFDGTLILPATKEFLNADFALKTFNTALSELLLGGIYSEAVSPDDIGYGRITLSAYARIDGGGDGAAASFHRAARTKHVGTLDVIRLLKPETIQIDDVERALAAGRRATRLARRGAERADTIRHHLLCEKAVG